MSDKTKLRLKYIVSGVFWIVMGVFVGGKVEPILWDIVIPLVGFAATLFGLKFVAPEKE